MDFYPELLSNTFRIAKYRDNAKLLFWTVEGQNPKQTLQILNLVYQSTHKFHDMFWLLLLEVVTLFLTDMQSVLYNNLLTGGTGINSNTTNFKLHLNRT